MKSIVHLYPAVVHFVALLALPLSQPQQRHLTRLTNALLVGPRRKTLADLQRLCLDAPDVANWADFLRASPWDDPAARQALLTFAVADLLRRAYPATEPPPIFITFDDCTTAKDKDTHALQAVDWVFDHSQHRPAKGAVHLACRVHIGDYSYTVSWRLYLRASTVRRLNRQRPAGQKLRFRTKYQLAQELLEELRALLPRAATVYVLFDRWYASAKFISFIRRHGWHVICAVKANRVVSGRKLYDHDRSQKHTWYGEAAVPRADGTTTTYYTRLVYGQIRGVAGRLRVVISRRHPRDRSPKYFLCTDPKLSVAEILTYYQRRWSQEVDFWYLKQELGLGDFRVQGYEAIVRWYTVVYLSWTFVRWQYYEQRATGRPVGNPATVLGQLRHWHGVDLLRDACAAVLRSGDIASVLHRYTGVPPEREAG